ncbi:hypothetical protein [Flindersiella endophytica]
MLTRLARRDLLVVLVLVAYAWIGSGFASMTWPATVAVAVPAALVAVAVLRRPAGERTGLGTALRRTTIAWAVLIGVGLLWEAWAFFHQPAPTVSSWHYPTLSALLDPVLDHRVLRFAGWLIWLQAGRRLLEGLR